MPSNINSTRYPDPVVSQHIVEKLLNCPETSWPTDQTAVQAYRHHFGGRLTLNIQHIKRVLEILIELLSRVEALGRRKPHVIGVEGVGYDKVWASGLDPAPER